MHSLCISEEGKIGLAALIEAVLDRLRHDNVFKERSAKRMSRDLSRVFDAKEVAREPDIVEVELGRLCQTLSDAGVKRRLLERDIAGLQEGEPLSRRRVGNSGIRAERTQVEQLSNAPSAETYKTPEARQVANPAKPTHVTLDIGLEVVTERLACFEPLVEYSGIES